VALDPSAQAAVVSAPRLNLFATGINRGVLYTFVNLQSISAPTVNERAILYANDGNAGDLLGISAAAWNLNALAGAPGDDTDAVTDHGSAYLWRSFDQPTGLVNFHVKLTAGDRAAGDEFGRAVALSGNTTLNSTYALVGAPGDDFGAVSNQGSAYLFNLGASATGTVTQTAKLVASTGNAEHVFGSSVAISGQVGLVGSPANGAPGHAYLFLNLASASGTVNETLRLSSPNQLADNAFGASVAIDGDMIVVGEPARFLSLDERGRSFTTRVSDLTTVDTAAAVREIDQLLVRSRGSWIIGQTQDNITMTLGGAAEMQLVTSGTGIRVGNTHAADNNLLVVLGTVAGAPAVTVGTGSNTGNQLRVNGAVTANAVTVTGSVRPGTTGIGALTVQGDVTWNAGTAWQFNLGASNSSDRLQISGATSDFFKGTGSGQRVFDFGGSSQAGTFTLVQWGGATNFTAADFAATGLAGGLNATFSIVGKTLTVTTGTLNPLQAWRQTHFGNHANTGNGADDFDFDKDGVPNLLEYALGTVPTNPASRQAPVLGQSSNRLTLRFTPQVVSGLTYKVQTSSDLSNWSDTTLGGLTAGAQFLWTDSAAISPAPPGRRFVRLHVSY
jgi:hypothetical protein